MTSSAPIGSYTPGPNTYGLVASSRRSRLLGSSLRDAGTLNSSGSRGVETRSIRRSLSTWLDLLTLGREGLLVLVIAVARLRAFALVRRRLCQQLLRLIGSFHEPKLARTRV